MHHTRASHPPCITPVHHICITYASHCTPCEASPPLCHPRPNFSINPNPGGPSSIVFPSMTATRRYPGGEVVTAGRPPGASAPWQALFTEEGGTPVGASLRCLWRRQRRLLKGIIMWDHSDCERDQRGQACTGGSPGRARRDWQGRTIPASRYCRLYEPQYCWWHALR